MIAAWGGVAGIILATTIALIAGGQWIGVVCATLILAWVMKGLIAWVREVREWL